LGRQIAATSLLAGHCRGLIPASQMGIVQTVELLS
jgi:hypothetical protein